jgi:cell division protein FtsB
LSQLLADIAELRNTNAELAAQNTSFSAENTNLRAQMTATPTPALGTDDLRAQFESERNDLRARVKTLSSDLAFTKNLYDTASTRAVENADLSRELQAKLGIKEGQLITGLKQKDIHSTAVRARDQQLILTLQAQNKLLLDQARKTDDALRAKAVMYPRMKKENEELLATNADLEGRVENLSKRNEQLVDQVQALRARQMGILQGNEQEEEDEGSETDTGSYDSDESGGDMGARGYATRPVGMTSSGEYYESANIEEGDVEVKVEQEDVGIETDGPGLAYECQYRTQEGDKLCGQLLATRGVSRSIISSGPS